MKLIERKSDLVTGEENMEDLHTLLDFPVFMGCVEHPKDQDITAELTWQINKNSGFLQLKKLIPLEILYQAQHNGAVGGIWMEHHQRFAEFLQKIGPSSVLELGGAHGILSVNYSKLEEISWTILEPNPAPIAECKARFIKGFFDENFDTSEDFDTVVHSHVFEHIYKPADFIKQLSDFLKQGKKLVFSLPNMQSMLTKKYTNCINFEHTVFLTEPYVEYFLTHNGFKIVSKEYFMEDHSIFYATIRDSETKPIQLPKGLYENNKKLYLDYVDYYKKLITEINIKMSQSTKPIYLFGAHVFSQYLIQMGLDTSKILGILDNDPKKNGQRLYGTNLNVTLPEILSKIDNPIIILKAGVYNDEIKNQIVGEINSSAVFF